MFAMPKPMPFARSRSMLFSASGLVLIRLGCQR
jgi:hypothetical protein